MEGPGPHFSVSHSGEWSVIAETALGPIGIDIECVVALPSLEAIVAQRFAPAQARQIMEESGERRLEAFYRCWTRMEAQLKATGAGFAAGLDTTMGDPDPRRGRWPASTRAPGSAAPWSSAETTRGATRRSARLRWPSRTSSTAERSGPGPLLPIRPERGPSGANLPILPALRADTSSMEARTRPGSQRTAFARFCERRTGRRFADPTAFHHSRSASTGSSGASSSSGRVSSTRERRNRCAPTTRASGPCSSPRCA